jgi:hypothetical protein
MESRGDVTVSYDVTTSARGRFSADLPRAVICVGPEALGLALRFRNECEPTCIVMRVGEIFSRGTPSVLVFVIWQ